MAGLGKVYLVGGGPGDPRLLTLRGLECLREADLVLYDGLVDPLLLRHTSAKASRTCRVSGPGGRRLDQAEINEQLVEAAKRGLTVVRLKGGDPFVFGRGGEEAAALRAAGIDFEVVPGITAATAVAAYAGITLTHRESASAVAFVTGHEDPTKPESRLDYDALARFPGTLVFYMGLHRLPVIAETLIASGKDPMTAACAISRGATPRQRVLEATLAELPERVAAAGLRAPSLIVVGDCIRVRDVADWYERRPLFGTRIGITRPESQAEGVVQRCLALGAEPIVMPTIVIGPPDDFAEVDAVLDRLHDFDWVVFTSTNGVDGLLDRLRDRGGDARRFGSARIAAIGPATAEALSRHGLRADLVPDTYRAEELAESLAPHVSGRRVLWARANRGRDVLPERLAAAGATLEQTVVYRNDDVDAWPDEVQSRITSGDVDWIGLSSPSIARQVARLLPATARPPRLASISPVTSDAAREAGLVVDAEAVEFTWDGILSAITAATSESGKSIHEPAKPAG